jgi:hypothetical protein
MDIKYFELANKLNRIYKQLLLDNKVHFRASFNSISMISLNNGKPELGVKCNATKYSLADNIQSIILCDIGKIKTLSIPKRPTPEKELQAWIINYALYNNHQLPFDTDIKFITSELAIRNNVGKKIVVDILGYNESKKQLYVIELKSDRLKKRLIQQVFEFEKVINENTYFFSQLLALEGFLNPINFSINIQKAIVWPYGKTSPKEELKRADIIEFTYQGHYSFSNHR